MLCWKQKKINLIILSFYANTQQAKIAICNVFIHKKANGHFIQFEISILSMLVCHCGRKIVK